AVGKSWDCAGATLMKRTARFVYASRPSGSKANYGSTRSRPRQAAVTQLAPRNLANVHPDTPKCGPVSSGASASLGQLRDLGNRARDYRRPKSATPAGTGLS